MIIAQITNSIPPDTAADIAKVFNDFGIHATASGIGQLLALIFIGARLLRKGIPDKMQTGIVGTVLKHAALEINPQLTPEPPAKQP